MADIKFTLLADDSQFNQTVNKAIQDMRKLATEAGASAEDINKAFQEMGKNVFSETGAKGIADTIVLSSTAVSTTLLPIPVLPVRR
mgnify:CR=1 FL=1